MTDHTVNRRNGQESDSGAWYFVQVLGLLPGRRPMKKVQDEKVLKQPKQEVLQQDKQGVQQTEQRVLQ